MIIQSIPNTPKQNPTFGKMIFKPMSNDFIQAIENNNSLNKLSKELETIGRDLVFSTGSCCDAFTVNMYANANHLPYKADNGVHLEQIAGSLPANCNKMVKQIEEYSCDKLLETIRLGKKLFTDYCKSFTK